MVKTLGEGAHSNVLLAQHKIDGHHYAIKQMRQGEPARNEVKLMASLNHPNLVRYHTSFVHNGENQIYLVMELCQKSLRKAIGQLDESKFLKIFFNICQGLRYLHERDIVHLDVKPSNILESLSQTDISHNTSQ